MRLKYIVAVLVVAIGTLLIAVRYYTSSGYFTRSIEDPPKMIAAILAQIPVGTPIEDAERFMVQEGFACSRSANAARGNRNGLDYVYCTRSDGIGPVQRVWKVAVVHRDGKVVEVLAFTSLDGP